MTWNLWGRFGPWRARQPAIVETISSVRPDLLALQETWSTDGDVQADGLAAQLGLEHVFSPSHMPDDPDPAVELGLAVLSRWPISTSSPVRLTTGDGPGTVALLAEIAHPHGTLRFMTACLDWEQDRHEVRRQQARDLTAVLMAPELDGPLPVVLAGDLNAPPHAPEIRELAAVMTDCWAHGQSRSGATFDSGNPYVPDDDWHTGSRIDYVFARAGDPAESPRVEGAALAGLPAEGTTVPSDHYAVVAELSTAEPE